MKKVCFLTIFVLLNLVSWSQLPNTQLYLLDMKMNEVKVVLENPRLLTSFNSEGYNNQPHFINDNELLFTSDWRAAGLTDILKLDLSGRRLTRLTATGESEYSPTSSADGANIFVVRQELSDEEAVPQILWQYPSDLSHFGKAVIDEYENIGYFRFVEASRIALFLVGPPHKLVIRNLSDNSETFIAYNIGRTLKLDKNGDLLYVQKIGNTSAIRRYDIKNDLSQLITYTLDGTEDFEVLSNGNFIAGQGSKLFRYNRENKDGWVEILDLSSKQISRITRICATEDKIAFVGSR